MKLNKGFLIISIAMALLIFGASFALAFRFGYEIGLSCGLGALLLLIAVMLLLNKRYNKMK